jgi:L-lactate dehydrogenase complex protein LldF
LMYSRPAVYRWATLLMSRFRALTPRSQGAWTSCRVPMKPAPRRLRDLLAARGSETKSRT